MFKVMTADGPKYMVQLVGPASYRMGGQITFRGSTLTVSERTRKYLVRKTAGAWVDFDPTPAEEIEEVMPPQFGESGGPSIDMEDLDPKKNPPLSMAQAAALAGTEVDQMGDPVDMTPDGPDLADLTQQPSAKVVDTAAGSGDMSGADLKQAKTPAPGGKSAAKTVKAVPAKTGGVKVTNAPQVTTVD